MVAVMRVIVLFRSKQTAAERKEVGVARIDDRRRGSSLDSCCDGCGVGGWYDWV